MIGILEQLQRRARSELSGERLQELQVRELIASALQKQHRNPHVEEMLRALVRRTPRRMQRESQERQAVDSGQRRCGLCLRSHATAEGFAAREEGEPG